MIVFSSIVIFVHVNMYLNTSACVCVCVSASELIINNNNKKTLCTNRVKFVCFACDFVLEKEPYAPIYINIFKLGYNKYINIFTY